MGAGELLESACAALRASGIEPARLEAEILLGEAAGWTRAAVLAYPERRVPLEARRRFLAWLDRRCRERVPIQYLTRKQEFWSLKLYVDERVLIPRPETECLVEEVLRRAGPRPETWVDVGTGSGAVALALASERTDCRVLALDVSLPALAVAAENRRRLSVPGARVLLAAGDLLQPVTPRAGRIDRIAANLPYIAAEESGTLAPEVAGHEPAAALFAAERGAALIRRLVPQAAERLAAGGSLHLEIAPGLRDAVVSMMSAAGAFGPAEVRDDALGLARVVSAVRLG